MSDANNRRASNVRSSAHASNSGNSKQVLTVSALTQQIKRLLEGKFPRIAVSGEISDVTKPSSGHIYFTLKDQRSQIRAVIWRTQAARLQFDLRNGQEVVCRGNLDVYPPRGSYQLVAQQIDPVGVGDLQLRLKQLQRKLAAQGLFDPAHKKPLPAFVRHAVLVTSPTGAAVRDFLEVAKRRWSAAKITIAPVRVQGEGAGVEIATMVRRLQRLQPAPDLLVVTRGGGSVEDLWCFNDEALVRAVHASTIPIISAVGHEVDVSLCDLAADVRALTPTEAAELALPSAEELKQRIDQLRLRLRQSLTKKAEDARQQLTRLQQRHVLQRPQELVFQRQRQLDEWQQRATRAISRRLRDARSELAHAAGRLESLSPLGVLQRGYAVALDENDQLIADAQSLEVDQEIKIRFRDGQASAQVKGVAPG